MPLELKAGPYLDSLIAERIFACKIVPHYAPTNPWLCSFYSCGCDDKHPHNDRNHEQNDYMLAPYSTDIGAAWEVVEKFSIGGGQVRISNKAQGNTFWWCYIYLVYSDDGPHVQGISQAPTAPLAICRAALQAVKD